MFLPAYTRMLLDMHRQEPFTGVFLTIGRQTVPFTLREACDFLIDAGVGPTRNASVLVRFDKTAAGAGHPDWVNDETFFDLFCKARVISLDVSAYEKATIIHDMNEPISRKLHGIADFIFEGSSIDNIFNPAQAMMNIHAMLAPGGRLFMVNAGSIVPGDTFVALGEEWYTGFLQQNGYKDISVETWSYDRVDDPVWRKGHSANCCVVVKARKGRNCKPVAPIQHGYDIQHHPRKYQIRNLLQRIKGRLSR